MALLKMGSLIDAISGKVGGQIFSISDRGITIKNNSWSQQPNSVAQSIQRQIIWKTSQAWRTLSISEQDSFNLEVNNYPYVNRVGDTVYYNGYELFNFLNQARLITLQSILTTAPAFVALPIVSYSVNTVSSLSVLIDYATSSFPMYFIIQATRSISPGLQPKNQDFLQISRVLVASSPGTFNLSIPYATKFGAPVVGLWIWFRIKVIVPSTGNNDGFSPHFGSVVS